MNLEFLKMAIEYLQRTKPTLPQALQWWRRLSLVKVLLQS